MRIAMFKQQDVTTTI